jgi:hypothetical protein
LMIRITNVHECDARGVDSSKADWQIKKPQLKRLKK